MPLTKGSTNRKDSGIDLKQRKFPRRTHIARERPARPSVTKGKRQASLTQLPFLTTPSPSFVEPEVYSDYDDPEVEEPRPKKKQRLSFAGGDKVKKASAEKSAGKKLESRQDTLTQLCDWIPSSAPAEDDIEDDSDDPGFDIHSGEGLQRFNAMIGGKQQQRKRQHPWLAQGDDATRLFTPGAKLAGRYDLRSAGKATNAVDDSDYISDSARRFRSRSSEKAVNAVDDSGYISGSTHANETPMRRYNFRSPAGPLNETSERQHNIHNPAGVKKPALAVNLSAHSIATHDFHTPRKSNLMQEIPSSHTPPSTNVLSQQSQRSSKRTALLQQSPLKNMTTYTRSPLKEKSANIRPARWNPGSPESQNPAMKMLEKVRLGKMAALGAAAIKNHEILPAMTDNAMHLIAEPTPSQAMPAPLPPPRPRTLKRTRTVQDSQAEEFDLLAQRPPRKLTRTNTVQDSQSEELDLTAQIYRTVSSESLHAILETDPVEGDYEDYDYDENYDNEQCTYDPVSAALDRDAARYGMTQTQAPISLANDSLESSDDSDEDDLNRGIIPDSDDEEEILAISPVRYSNKQGSQELPCSDFADLGPKMAETQALIAVTLSSDPAPEVASSSQPSSPPPSNFLLHPSQVSTVVPTQASPSQLRSHHYSPPSSPPPEVPQSEHPPLASRRTHTTRLLFPKSQAQTQAQLTFSSSPLALPPWSSPRENLRWAGTQSQVQRFGNGEELDLLTDFSLPPPPPVPSSAAGRSSSPWR